MTYWETLDENRRRSGLPAQSMDQVKKNDYAGKSEYVEKKDHQKDKRSMDSTGSNTILGNIRWMKETDGMYRLYVPPGAEYNLFNLVKVSLANPIDARFNIPLLESPSDSSVGSSWTQKLANLAKQYGNMVSISVVPKTEPK